MASTYQLVSGDSHIVEPPNLYLDRVPAKYRDRAPHQERLPKGDGWVMEGAIEPFSFGLNSAAGVPYEQISPWGQWDEVRKGGYDPAERIKDQEKDGVDAEVLYPTPRISSGVLVNRSDPEYQLALVRAYNDWLSEFCSHAPDRLIGMVMIPTVGIEPAMAELARASDLPGMKGALLRTFPNGSLDIGPEDDRFWQACQELGWTVNIHVGMGADAPKDFRRGPTLPGDVRFYDAPKRIMQFIFTDVFERFPKLAIVFAEVDCGWVPYFKEQLDDRYKRIHHWADIHLKRPPSAYCDSNIYYTYITDSYAVDNRHRVGIDNMLWSSDYPHIGTDWPNSWQTIERDFAGVPIAERHQILAGNASRLYQLG
jgi:predicted TIM-barrel fold metal-dependent hydrolase